MNNLKISQRQLRFTLCSKFKNILNSVVPYYPNPNKVSGTRLYRQNKRKGIVNKTELTNQHLDNIKEVLTK